MRNKLEKNFLSYIYTSPMGDILIQADDLHLLQVKFIQNHNDIKTAQGLNPVISSCISQLDEYFNKKRKAFSLPMLIQGSNFSKQVWSEIEKVDYATTNNYQSIAKNINSISYRGVARACGANKFHIIIPCHRVINSNGSLSGYAGGVNKKTWLINHERANNI